VALPTKHQNNGDCPKCKELFDKYPGFYQPLRDWFISFQKKCPEAHISCAGRGAVDQDAKKLEGRSKASFGKSAHNYNAAIDLFVNKPFTNLYDLAWFNANVAPAIPLSLNWYGSPGSRFPEIPHIEARNWKELRDAGVLTLVEPMPAGDLS